MNNAEKMTPKQLEWLEHARRTYTENNLTMEHKPDVAIEEAEPIDLLLGVVALTIHEESIGDYICNMLHANDYQELNLFKTEDFIVESNKITDRLFGVNDGTVKGEIMAFVKEMAESPNVVEMGFGFEQDDGSMVEGHMDSDGNYSENVTGAPVKH